MVRRSKHGKGGNADGKDIGSNASSFKNRLVIASPSEAGNDAEKDDRISSWCRRGLNTGGWESGTSVYKSSVASSNVRTATPDVAYVYALTSQSIQRVDATESPSVTRAS